MGGQAKFNPEVQRAVFTKRRMTSRCLEHVPATSLVDMLAKIVKEDQRKWDFHIQSTCLTYNTCVHISTGFTPSFLEFGFLEFEFFSFTFRPLFIT